MNQPDALRTVDAPEWVIDLVAKYQTAVKEVRSYPQHFGNFVVVLDFSGRLMRVARDRGEVSVEARVLPSLKWIPPSQWGNCPFEIAKRQPEEVANWAAANPTKLG
jgi:hypothetical protein